MTLIEDNRTGGFTFTWSIHNFSYCVQKENECLDSPQFVAQLLGNAVGQLQLYPRGKGAPNFISYYLNRYSDVSAKFVLSIRVSSGLFKEMGMQTYRPHNSTIQGYKEFLSLDELKGPDAYLDNDTLTLRCRMWKDDTDLSTSVKFYAHTKIKVAKITHMWTLKDIVDSNHDSRIIKYKFNQTTEIPHFSTGIPRFTIRLLYGGTYGDDTIHFAIEYLLDINKLFLICMIHLLDADGRVAHSVRGDYLFEYSNGRQIWTLPFLSKRKLLSKEKLYLPNGKLSLCCEFSTSTGAQNSEIESIEYGITEDLQLQTSTNALVPDIPGTWKENMKRFYNEGKFSDLNVRTPNRQFPVHKAILCAQSEVFSAMFESDMKENQTGVVEIEDLEDDTVSKMLLFLYTDTLEDIDCSMACKLYFAADKYRITALQRKCSNFLINSLATSNVCDVLVLADTHHDQELKSIARDFIFTHAHEIMNSEDWKNLMEDKAHLTSETMQLMICKNFLGYLKP